MDKKPIIANPQPAFFTRRNLLLSLGGLALGGVGATLFLGSTPAKAGDVEVFKDPSCQCCGRWVRHMRQNGFSVDVKNVEDMDPIKARAGIPDAMESCHTAFIDGYAVEGHVPAQDIRRMLAERPAIKGLAVPGMPSSAPGMDNPDFEPFTVLAFDDKGRASVFASY
ncbi:MAG: DUF411 domain-containing protein [Rhodospirillales bacterium]|nr:DUF411 domain-containing protein [Rhodospirillales bacterium]